METLSLQNHRNDLVNKIILIAHTDPVKELPNLTLDLINSYDADSLFAHLFHVLQSTHESDEKRESLIDDAIHDLLNTLQQKSKEEGMNLFEYMEPFRKIRGINEQMRNVLHTSVFTEEYDRILFVLAQLDRAMAKGSLLQFLKRIGINVNQHVLSSREVCDRFEDINQKLYSPAPQIHLIREWMSLVQQLSGTTHTLAVSYLHHQYERDTIRLLESLEEFQKVFARHGDFTPTDRFLTSITFIEALLLQQEKTQKSTSGLPTVEGARRIFEKMKTEFSLLGARISSLNEIFKIIPEIEVTTKNKNLEHQKAEDAYLAHFFRLQYLASQLFFERAAFFEKTERYESVREYDFLAALGLPETSGINFLLEYGAQLQKKMEMIIPNKDEKEIKSIKLTQGKRAILNQICQFFGAFGRYAFRIRAAKIAEEYLKKASELATLLNNTSLLTAVNTTYQELAELNSTAQLERIISDAGRVDEKDAFTGSHIHRVEHLVRSFLGKAGDELRISPREREDIVNGALIHDVGKAEVPDRILQMPGRLKREDLRKMRGHALFGAKRVRHFLPMEIVLCVRDHHQRWDGKGYPAIKEVQAGEKIDANFVEETPDGKCLRPLYGDEISTGALVVGFFDSISAMMERRVYDKNKSGETPEEAFVRIIQDILKNKGTQFAPHIVDLFIKDMNIDPQRGFTIEHINPSIQSHFDFLQQIIDTKILSEQDNAGKKKSITHEELMERNKRIVAAMMQKGRSVEQIIYVQTKFQKILQEKFEIM